MKQPITKRFKVGVFVGVLAALLLGAVSVHNFDSTLRTVEYRIHNIAIPVRTVDAGIFAAGWKVDAGVQVDGGLNGVVTAMRFTNDAGLADGGAVDAGRIFPPPYPARLAVGIVNDGSRTSTITCTSVAMAGFDQFGNSVRETITNAGTALQLTKYSYEKVTSIVPSACGSQDAGVTVLNASALDLFVVLTSQQVGLTRTVYTNAALGTGFIAVCKYNSTAAVWQCVNGSACSIGTQTSPSGVYAHAIDLTTCGLGIAAGDQVRIRYRSPQTAQ